MGWIDKLIEFLKALLPYIEKAGLLGVGAKLQQGKDASDELEAVQKAADAARTVWAMPDDAVMRALCERGMCDLSDEQTKAACDRLGKH